MSTWHGVLFIINFCMTTYVFIRLLQWFFDWLGLVETDEGRRNRRRKT